MLVRAPDQTVWTHNFLRLSCEWGFSHFHWSRMADSVLIAFCPKWQDWRWWRISKIYKLEYNEAREREREGNNNNKIIKNQQNYNGRAKPQSLPGLCKIKPEVAKKKQKRKLTQANRSRRKRRCDEVGGEQRERTDRGQRALKNQSSEHLETELKHFRFSFRIICLLLTHCVKLNISN